ncbi:hypothetical protein [Candidatus Poriferisodalis sp.]|uniref:hypothetical protein n=1 Tax=Candidatus Poriferisodalis sp. TaxID=3101277 RepID=UPI003D13A446
MAAVSEGSPGRFVSAEWNGRPVEAWVPAPLSERDLSLTASDARAAERAVATLRAADSRLPATWEVHARLLLRHQGIASSGIEGLREPVESVLVAERIGGGDPVGWIADNLAVIGAALDGANQHGHCLRSRWILVGSATVRRRPSRLMGSMVHRNR